MANFIQDYLAAQGRMGDSELRNVGGEMSHVNPKEASNIDNLGVLGQVMTQTTGSGTINPMTGMREYSEGYDWGEFKDMSPSDFVNMDDEQRLQLGQDLGYKGLSQDDKEKYMPGYDAEDEERKRKEAADRQGYMRRTGATQIGRIGEQAQGQMSQQVQQASSMKAQRNF